MSRTVDERVLRDAIERLAFLETRRGHTRNREYDAALDHLAAALSAERERAEAAERLAERRGDALAGLLANPRWVSIGSIDNHAELPRISREKYEQLTALLASLPDGEQR